MKCQAGQGECHNEATVRLNINGEVICDMHLSMLQAVMEIAEEVDYDDEAIMREMAEAYVVTMAKEGKIISVEQAVEILNKGRR